MSRHVWVRRHRSILSRQRTTCVPAPPPLSPSPGLVQKCILSADVSQTPRWHSSLGAQTPARGKPHRRHAMVMMTSRKIRIQRKLERPAIFTIGHSTRPIDEFIRLLQENGIEQLIDIRTITRSRHNPQFNADSLARSLRTAKIDYVHIKELGGLRRSRPDSRNTGWRNASFRGFADYMQTAEFESGLDQAIKLATAKRSALMCAEAVPWRCHRSLVADALIVRGVEVLEIVGDSPPKPHKMTPFARVSETEITYPPEEGELFSAPDRPLEKVDRGGAPTVTRHKN